MKMQDRIFWCCVLNFIGILCNQGFPIGRNADGLWKLNLKSKSLTGKSTKNYAANFKVVAPINQMIETVPFDMHCYSLDWHPTDHVSFIDNVQMRRLYPGSKVE